MLTTVNNPLTARDVATLRNVRTSSGEFRAAMRRIGTVLACEAAHHISTRTERIQTPLEETDGTVFGHDVVLLPVLRAGVALIEPFQELMPEAKIGYIGLSRNEHTLASSEYYFNMPRLDEHSLVFVLDPMLATGGSICATLERLQQAGARRFIVVSVIAAPEGVRRLESAFAGIHILTAALDRCLNEQGFIVPGLGDAGDRYHGT